MEQIAETSGDTPERRKLFADFVEDSEAHASAEELVFYSRLMEDTSTRGKSAHSIEEHPSMRDVVRAMKETDPASPGWLNAFHRVRERLDQVMDRIHAAGLERAGEGDRPDSVRGANRAAFDRLGRAILAAGLD